MYQNDETLPNFIKRKHPKKAREKRNKGQGPKSKQASKQPKHASSPSMQTAQACMYQKHCYLMDPRYEQDPMTLHRGKVWIMLQKNLGH
jgi:hypothetical protein